MEAGRHAEALAILKKLAAKGEARSFEWFDIAVCHERLGDGEAALAAIEHSIGDGNWWPPYEKKAKLLEKYRGPKAATTWLEQLHRDNPERRKYAHILGNVYRSAGRVQEAVTYYRRAVELACKQHSFTFGPDHVLVLDAATLAKENNDYASLWPTLESLARCLDSLGQKGEALRYATMGVSIGQQLNRCKGYYDQPAVDAGDFDCRLLRARILMDRGELDGAAIEIAHARVRADDGPTRWKRGVSAAEKRLEKLRRE